MNVPYLNSQMELFIKDKTLIEQKIPSTIIVGFIAINLSQYKQQILEIINDLIEQLSLKLEKNLYKLNVKDNVVLDLIIERLTQRAKFIPEFIDLEKYIHGKFLRENKAMLIEHIEIATQLLESLERFNVQFD